MNDNLAKDDFKAHHEATIKVVLNMSEKAPLSDQVVDLVRSASTHLEAIWAINAVFAKSPVQGLDRALLLRHQQWFKAFK